MLRALLAKDLRRVRRNPAPWLLNLALPIFITAVIGMVFGGSGQDNSLGRIRFGVVDEDKSPLADFLRGAASQGKAAQYLEPVFLERGEAEQQLRDDQLSAILVIPPHFTSNYLNGQKVQLDLIKNPAEQIHPTVLEELLSVVTAGLNIVSRNFSSEFPSWRHALEGDPDYLEVAQLITQSGEKFHAARAYLLPPLVSFTNATEEIKPAKAAAGEKAKAATPFSIFPYLLIGMAGMFLLMLANQGMTDLHREIWKRTLERYSTLHAQLLPFVMAKAVFTAVIVSVGAAIMLIGGQWLFHFRWPHPVELGVLTVAYVCFATGLMAVTVAVVPDERRANALNNILSMILSMAGGCMFPPEQLPEAMRDHLSPLLPTYWFSDTARHLLGSGEAWLVPAGKLAVLGALCLALSAFLFKRRFNKGLR